MSQVSSRILGGAAFVVALIGCTGIVSPPKQDDVQTSSAVRGAGPTAALSGPGSGTGTGGGRGARGRSYSTPATVDAQGFSPLSPDLSSGTISGYRHQYAKSKFKPGADVVTAIDAWGTKYVGSDGTFFEWSNGYSGGIASAHASSKSVAPYSLSSDAHNELVLEYFEAAGLPADQVRDVFAHATMRATGKGLVELSRQLLGFASVVSRSVDGAPVIESFAWARFNKDGDAVEDRVWWPDLPASLHSDLATMRGILADPTAATAFKAKLPADVTDTTGVVVIHHSAPAGKTWRAYVSYDVSAQGSSTTRSYDALGKEIAFTW